MSEKIKSENDLASRDIFPSGISGRLQLRNTGYDANGIRC